MSNYVFKRLLSVYFLRATNNASVEESIRQYFQCNVIKLWSIKQKKMTYFIYVSVPGKVASVLMYNRDSNYI